MICCQSSSIVGMPYLQFLQHAVKKIVWTISSGTITADICTIYAFDLRSINHLKPSTALYAWHVQVIYKILTRDHLWSRGLPMAAMLGPGNHLWQPHLVRGIDYGGTIDGMTGYARLDQEQH